MLDFYTDHYFHVGNAHIKTGRPCQDYATSGIVQETAYAIVSDGCSSGGNTDVGARILALGTACAIRELRSNSHIVSMDNQIQMLYVQARTRALLGEASALFNLDAQDILATCLYACLSPTSGIIRIEGDGVVAVVCKDKNVHLCRFEWQNNAPFYPAYQGDALEKFIELHGGDFDAPCATEDQWFYKEDKFIHILSRDISLATGISGITMQPPFFGQSLDEIDYVALFSDGVTQIKNLDWKNAVLHFLSFKTLKGAFVKRRMIREIKDLQKDGNELLDDIAVAIIRAQPSEESEENI